MLERNIVLDSFCIAKLLMRQKHICDIYFEVHISHFVCYLAADYDNAFARTQERSRNPGARA